MCYNTRIINGYKGDIINKKDKRIFIMVSEKMLKDFTKICKKNEVTKSEIIRECIRKYIKKNKGGTM